jgi:hypothetical protein
MVIFHGYLYAIQQPPSLQSCSPHPSATIAMAFRACRFALRAARSKVVALGARPALAAATGAIAAGYAFSKPSGCQAPQLVDVSGLTKVAKTDDAPWISMDPMLDGYLVVNIEKLCHGP